jgi:phasin family protein
MYDQFMKSFQAFKTPQFDTAKLAAAQQKNITNMTSIMQHYGETAQTLAQKATEFAQQNVETAMNASREIMTTTAPEKNISNQGDFVKKAATTFAKQSKEFTKIATDAQVKAVEAATKQFGETIDDLKTAA